MKYRNWKIKSGNLEIKDGVNSIIAGAFSNSRLVSVKLPDSLVKIGDFSFIDNDLINITLPSGLNSIGENAFSFNQLRSLEVPASVRAIGKSSFSNNRLTNVMLNDGIIRIEDYAFSNNFLTSVIIPESVKYIGENAFTNTDVIYDGVEVKKELLSKYGSENIIKLVNLFKIFKREDIINFPLEVIKNIPCDLDSLKGFQRNYKVYNNLRENLNISNEEKESFFKLCYILGLFKSNSKNIVKLVKDIMLFLRKTDHNNSLKDIVLNNYKPGAKELIESLFLENKLKYKNQIVIGRIYQFYENIKGYTIKRHKLIISKKNTEVKKLEKIGANTDDLKRELEMIKKNIKAISYEDLICYFENNKLDIRKGNEDLSEVIDELSVYMNQKDFNILQDLYQISQEISKNIPITKDDNKNDITYSWASSNDPINIILGYVLKSCAKLGDVGEDIMRQSMINPDVVNLIIYDGNKKVIGKATAYFNKNKKYILFNSAVLKRFTSKDLKSEEKRKKDCLKAILRATKDVVLKLKSQGVNINEVRIGMTRNDLSETINKFKLDIILDDLLYNYDYKGYEGDANGLEGQAILYRDKEDFSYAKIKWS